MVLNLIISLSNKCRSCCHDFRLSAINYSQSLLPSRNLFQGAQASGHVGFDWFRWKQHDRFLPAALDAVGQFWTRTPWAPCITEDSSMCTELEQRKMRMSTLCTLYTGKVLPHIPFSNNVDFPCTTDGSNSGILNFWKTHNINLDWNANFRTLSLFCLNMTVHVYYCNFNL